MVCQTILEQILISEVFPKCLLRAYYVESPMVATLIFFPVITYFFVDLICFLSLKNFICYKEKKPNKTSSILFHMLNGHKKNKNYIKRGAVYWKDLRLAGVSGCWKGCSFWITVKWWKKGMWNGWKFVTPGVDGSTYDPYSELR